MVDLLYDVQTNVETSYLVLSLVIVIMHDILTNVATYYLLQLLIVVILHYLLTNPATIYLLLQLGGSNNVRCLQLITYYNR